MCGVCDVWLRFGLMYFGGLYDFLFPNAEYWTLGDRGVRCRRLLVRLHNGVLLPIKTSFSFGGTTISDNVLCQPHTIVSLITDTPSVWKFPYTNKRAQLHSQILRHLTKKILVYRTQM